MQNIQFTAVTWYSKLLAAIVLLGALPVLIFYIGMQYQKTQEVLEYKEVPVAASAPVVTSTENGSDTAIVEACIDEEGQVIDLDTASQMQMNYCAAKDAAIAEGAMQTTYAAVLAQLASNKESGKKILQTVTDGQKLWLSYRDMHCKAEGLAYEGGSIQPLIVAGCKKNLTEERTKALQELLGVVSPL